MVSVLAESERILRDYDFISEVDIYPVEMPDGDVHVVVDTEDEWTTKFTARVDLDEGADEGKKRIFLPESVMSGNAVNPLPWSCARIAALARDSPIMPRCFLVRGSNGSPCKASSALGWCK